MTDNVQPKFTECSECGFSPHETSPYCSNCGAEDPWETHYKYNMDDVEFPVIVEMEMYNDDYELWSSFCYEVFGTRVSTDNIVNIPDSLPRMKYACPMTYWKITKSDVKGPYLSREDARNA